MFIELTSDWVNEWNSELDSPPNDLLGFLSSARYQPLCEEGKLNSEFSGRFPFDSLIVQCGKPQLIFWPTGLWASWSLLGWSNGESSSGELCIPKSGSKGQAHSLGAGVGEPLDYLLVIQKEEWRINAPNSVSGKKWETREKINVRGSGKQGVKKER